jgi:hypothetical protein
VSEPTLRAPLKLELTDLRFPLLVVCKFGPRGIVAGGDNDILPLFAEDLI